MNKVGTLHKTDHTVNSFQLSQVICLNAKLRALKVSVTASWCARRLHNLSHVINEIVSQTFRRLYCTS